MTPEEKERHERVMELRHRMHTISNHKELSVFVGDLVEAYSDECFEEQDIEDYLEGMEHLLKAMDSWARNTGWGDGAPEQPTWPWVARLLLSAFYNS